MQLSSGFLELWESAVSPIAKWLGFYKGGDSFGASRSELLLGQTMKADPA